MGTKPIWLAEARAEALAKIILTRQPGLAIIDHASPEGTDLLVSIKGGQHDQTGRLFGVKVLTAVHAEKRFLPDGRIKLTGVESPKIEPLRDLPFPVCLFFFTMEDDAGYFRWLREPVTSDADPLRLATNRDGSFVELTNDVVSTMLSKVDAWYDNRLSLV